MSDPRLDPALADASWLRRLARSLVRDAQRAEDAAQETLLRALARRVQSPRAWLSAVLRNELRQEARARSRRERHEAAARSRRAPLVSPGDDARCRTASGSISDGVAELA